MSIIPYHICSVPDNAKQIMFNAEMTRAIRNGTKTETRRAIKLKNPSYSFSSFWGGLGKVCALFDNGGKSTLDVNLKGRTFHHECVNSKHKVGDVLWVREPAKVISYDDTTLEMTYQYLSDDKVFKIKIPDRFLDDDDGAYRIKAEWIATCKGVPNGCIREMARMVLIVTQIDVEKLQTMSSACMIAEGIEAERARSGNGYRLSILHHLFIKLWNSTAPKNYKWEDDPYVFLYKFKPFVT